MGSRILLVDDDVQALESTKKILELASFEVTAASDGAQALELVRPSPGKNPGRVFDIVLTDVRMPKLGGIEFLRALSVCGEDTPVILMTAYGRVEDAVWAMKLGAVDFLAKPFKRQVLLSAIEAGLKRARARSKTSVKMGASENLLLGQSSAMKELSLMIRQVAPTAASVLLTGESGTGKELIARCIHQQSARSNGQFIALNCAALPEALIESELFGFEKGSFTGATVSREGLFEAASGGTLLLDEIGDMPYPLQAKLLRVLQDGEVRRIGSTVSRKIDVRVIAATHQNLKENAISGKFRQDLLYRLEVIHLQIKPLRDRLEDLPELAQHFVKASSLRHGKQVKGFSEKTMQALLLHSWPGNVRELSNVIERAVIFSTETLLELRDLPTHLARSQDGERHSKQTSSISVPLGTSLKAVEELMIRKTLEATSGDKNMTAKLLGINSRTIYRKLDKRVEKE